MQENFSIGAADKAPVIRSQPLLPPSPRPPAKHDRDSRSTVLISVIKCHAPLATLIQVASHIAVHLTVATEWD